MKLVRPTEIPAYLAEAARVSRFMVDEEIGRWHLRHFQISEDEYRRNVTVAQIKGRNPELEIARIVPPGDYITLRRKMTRQEKIEAIRDQIGDDIIDILVEHNRMTEDEAIEKLCPPDSAWIPVMSDTPAEMIEHDHALNTATGVVVITGLGLGCLPHALLAKPDVTEIHVIEIDPEVIALTGKYLTDPRVTIHQGSALDVERFLPRDMRVDYVWHDIWTHISTRNFRPETAEHGISYDMLFELYAQHLIVGPAGQSAWAWREAKLQQDEEDRIRNEELAFRARLFGLPLDEQVEVLHDRILRKHFIVGGRDAFEGRPIPEEFAAKLDPSGGLREHVRKTLADPAFWAKWREAEAWEDEDEPLGNPNEGLA